MSVDITGYVILGVDVQNYLDDLESDDRDDFIDKLETYTENNALEFIYDDMDGEYCYIGEVLNMVGDESGSNKKEHSLSELLNLRIALNKKLAGIGIKTDEPKIISFTHYH